MEGMEDKERQEFNQMLNRLPADQAVAAGQDPDAPAWWTGDEAAYSEGMSVMSALNKVRGG